MLKSSNPQILRSSNPEILKSRFQERLRIGPLPQLALKMPALVDQDLAVVGQHDPRAFERTRRRPFEIDSACAEAAAVTRALEFIFRREIVRCAPKMRADRHDCIKAAHMEVDIFGCPYEPDAELFLPALVDPDAVLVREAGLELLRRLVED